MLKPKIVELLNKQINFEQYASNLYLQMSAWCENKGYSGCADFLKGHAEEETLHMKKIFKFLNETGNLAIIGQVAAPKSNWDDITKVFEETLHHEKMITERINNLVAATLEEKDFSTFQFLQWYVAEQHEEEHLFQTIADKMRIIGTEGKGIYFFDKEVGKIAKAKALAKGT